MTVLSWIRLGIALTQALLQLRLPPTPALRLTRHRHPLLHPCPRHRQPHLHPRPQTALTTSGFLSLIQPSLYQSFRQFLLQNEQLMLPFIPRRQPHHRHHHLLMLPMLPGIATRRLHPHLGFNSVVVSRLTSVWL